jgi:type II secretory pathway predicted ATPase ExeA
MNVQYRFFNTEGPVDAERHYCVPPLTRLDLETLQTLIKEQKYFVLHAPRQTGKTTCLKAWVELLNTQNEYRACYFNIEKGQAFRDDVEKAFQAINGALVSRAEKMGETRLNHLLVERRSGSLDTFSQLLGHWAQLDPKPLVLVIDEADSLVGDTLIALLRALRTNYDERPHHFPSSVVLCGLRDIQDYRLFSSANKSVITGGSAFNIKSRSLNLDNLDRQQVEMLLAQHTEATGQLFTPEAMETIWDLSLGQPWLVNALAYQAAFEDKNGKDRSRPIDGALVETSKESLILRRDTHIHQLADKLREDRVRRVIQPILLGNDQAEVQPDDIQYCIDLGLIRRTDRGLDISNPIYREVIPRDLTADTQEYLKTRFAPDWVKPDGTLDLSLLLAAFQDFYLENGESWANRFAYREAGPQLLIQAFFQRVANGHGRVEREYALGTSRTDLYIRWPFPQGIQKAVIEVKVLHKSLKATIAKGLPQTAAYADRCGASEAHLLIFVRKPGSRTKQRVFKRRAKWADREITVWGL